MTNEPATHYQSTVVLQLIKELKYNKKRHTYHGEKHKELDVNTARKCNNLNITILLEGQYFISTGLRTV